MKSKTFLISSDIITFINYYYFLYHYLSQLFLVLHPYCIHRHHPIGRIHNYLNLYEDV